MGSSPFTRTKYEMNRTNSSIFIYYNGIINNGDIMKKVVIALIFTTLFIFGLFFYNLNKNEQNIIDKEEEKSVVTSIDMVMVGDMLVHGAVYSDAKTSTGYDFKPMIEYIKPIVSNYDIAFYNQETILGGTELGLSTYPRFNSPYEVGDAMIDAGFNIVALANNHTLDRGITAINNSLNYWANKDVLTAGSYTSFEDKNTVDIKEKNGITYTLLSYTYGTNGIPVPDGKEYLVNVYSQEKVSEDIARVRSLVDVLMVSIHWGTEYSHTPNKFQVEQAEYLSGLGVDIIIGHHPHVVQPITRIGNTVVIYSLGNFLSAQEGIDRLVGLMAGLTIKKTTIGNEKTITIDNIHTELLYTYYSHAKDFEVIPFSDINDTYLKNYENIYDTYKEIVLQYDNTIKVNK